MGRAMTKFDLICIMAAILRRNVSDHTPEENNRRALDWAESLYDTVSNHMVEP